MVLDFFYLLDFFSANLPFLIFVRVDLYVLTEASLSTLKQLSVVKSQHIPQLAGVIPYIDMSPNQEYLIFRIRG